MWHWVRWCVEEQAGALEPASGSASWLCGLDQVNELSELLSSPLEVMPVIHEFHVHV